MTIGYSKSSQLLKCTTSDLTYYVETTGSDTDSGLSVDHALATIQEALNRIPKYIKHLVIINVGIGSFAGFHAELFTSGAYSVGNLIIQGTQVEPTLVSGGKTNATADASGGSTSTLKDADGGWTTDELKGKFLVIGTATRPILSNTSTLITVSAPFTATTNSLAYRVVVNGTILNSASRMGTEIVCINNTCVFGYMYVKYFHITNSPDIVGIKCTGNEMLQAWGISIDGTGDIGYLLENEGSNGSHTAYITGQSVYGVKILNARVGSTMRFLVDGCSGTGIYAENMGYCWQAPYFTAINNSGDGIQIVGANTPAAIYLTANNNGGDGVLISTDGLYAYLYGTGNTGYGLRIYPGTRFNLTAATTITGAAGNYVFGYNYDATDVTGTWATDILAAGTLVACPDMNASIYRYA